jgi:hypothetical protein
MTDDPDLDPQQEEQVRALLADLGPATVPPEVAARLEETLAELVAERPVTEQAVVVPLRRRWATRAATAAAAVIVIGAGGVAVANLGGFGGSNDNAAGSTDSATAGGGSSSSESLGGTESPAPAKQPDSLSNGLPARLPRVSAASFDTDVTRLLQRRVAAAGDTAAQRKPTQETKQGHLYAASCPGPGAGNGTTTTPVLYDGTRAVLVIHPVQGDQRLVEAWTCGGERVLDSAKVPATGGSSPGDPGLASPSPSP